MEKDRRSDDDADYGIRRGEAILEAADQIDRADAEIRRAHEPTIAEATAAIKAGEHERAARLFETVAKAYADRFGTHYQIEQWNRRAADCREAARHYAKSKSHRKGKGKLKP